MKTKTVNILTGQIVRPIPVKPFRVWCKKSRAHSTCARGWCFKQYNYYAWKLDAESFLKENPQAEPVLHRRYGIGWKVLVHSRRCSKCGQRVKESDYCQVFFFDQPSVLEQEIMVHQQEEKLRQLAVDQYEI